MAGYFNDRSMIRRVQREHVCALAGPRALLMQAAHPVAFAGFFMSTGALADPYARLRRTGAVIDTVLFGERREADAVTARVRRVHRRFRGRLREAAGRFPAGTPWAADDPELLLWVIATLADSGLVVYERYVRRMTLDERTAYWSDYRLMGTLFGLGEQDMPGTYPEFERYLQEMVRGDVLHVTPQARDLAVDIVLHPPVPIAARPLLELANAITVGLLPPRIRRQYGLSWDPVRGLATRAGAEYAKRLLLPTLPGRLRYRSLASAA
jgi:uncharacterized protein (DUF2236 family)